MVMVVVVVVVVVILVEVVDSDDIKRVIGSGVLLLMNIT